MRLAVVSLATGKLVGKKMARPSGTKGADSPNGNCGIGATADGGAMAIHRQRRSD